MEQLDFSGPQWIWTTEVVPAGPGGNVPPGARAFRRLIPNPLYGVTPVHANILITADNYYTLFVNDEEVGQGDNFQNAQSYCVSVNSKCGTVVAVTVVNADGPGNNPAGLLAKIEITYDDGTTEVVVSDPAWKALNNANIPRNYSKLSFDDSAWPGAVGEGVNGNSPWNWINIPQASGISCKCAKPCKCASYSCGCGCN